MSLLSARYADARRLKTKGHTSAIIAGSRDSYELVEAERVIGAGGIDLATSVRGKCFYTRANRLSAEVSRYNMSGLWVDRRGDRLAAGVVGRGSPAELAGIKQGDRLGGKDFRTMIQQLNGLEGSTVSLTVNERPVAMLLRDYL